MMRKRVFKAQMSKEGNVARTTHPLRKLRSLRMSTRMPKGATSKTRRRIAPKRKSLIRKGKTRKMISKAHQRRRRGMNMTALSKFKSSKTRTNKQPENLFLLRT